jgi:DNA-binding protein YbaB
MTPKGPDMGQLMKQVQQMQADMAKAQVSSSLK